MFGQYQQRRMVHRRNYYPDHKGLDLKKLKINYENADGSRVFYDIQYDGYDYYLQEDSTGKSSSVLCNGRRKFTMIEFLVFATVSHTNSFAY